MKIEQVICDQCGARKGETNHWFSLYADENGFHFYPANGDISPKNKDICSPGCAIKALNEFLDPSFKERKGSALNQLEVKGKIMDYYAEKYKNDFLFGHQGKIVDRDRFTKEQLGDTQSFYHNVSCPALLDGICNCTQEKAKQ